MIRGPGVTMRSLFRFICHRPVSSIRERCAGRSRLKRRFCRRRRIAIIFSRGRSVRASVMRKPPLTRRVRHDPPKTGTTGTSRHSAQAVRSCVLIFDQRSPILRLSSSQECPGCSGNDRRSPTTDAHCWLLRDAGEGIGSAGQPAGQMKASSVPRRGGRGRPRVTVHHRRIGRNDVRHTGGA